MEITGDLDDYFQWAVHDSFGTTEGYSDMPLVGRKIAVGHLTIGGDAAFGMRQRTTRDSCRVAGSSS